jgi:hypothetical protein
MTRLKAYCFASAMQECSSAFYGPDAPDDWDGPARPPRLAMKAVRAGRELHRSSAVLLSASMVRRQPPRAIHVSYTYGV